MSDIKVDKVKGTPITTRSIDSLVHATIEEADNHCLDTRGIIEAANKVSGTRRLCSVATD